MTVLHNFVDPALTYAFIATQLLYLGAILVDIYIFSQPVDRVDMSKAADLEPAQYPDIVMFYPVLRELEDTMRTTFKALGEMDYPAGKFEVVAIPNWDDLETIGALRRLEREFSFLSILTVPPTHDEAWRVVWSNWDANPNAYWWHEGARMRDWHLPPKKTRQLIFSFYQMVERRRGRQDFLVAYIDADSCPPRDHLLGAAVGIQDYDVLQALNVAGNLNCTLAANWHAADHMAWDGLKYPHLSSHGRHPYWMLGKGLFFKASDLVSLGGFHPWITIEDPEVGMRFWAHGKRLGILESPLIEEVPRTFAQGVTQRKRWVCGFFQSLAEPLDRLEMGPAEKVNAWLIFLPCLSLLINLVGLPVGAWALWSWSHDRHAVPDWTIALAAFNSLGYAVSMTAFYISTWKKTALVLNTIPQRIIYMVSINPLFMMIWWLLWAIPLFIGFRMYLKGQGMVWERTEKVDANHALIRNRLSEPPVRRAEAWTYKRQPVRAAADRG